MEDYGNRDAQEVFLARARLLTPIDNFFLINHKNGLGFVMGL